MRSSAENNAFDVGDLCAIQKLHPGRNRPSITYLTTLIKDHPANFVSVVVVMPFNGYA